MLLRGDVVAGEVLALITYSFGLLVRAAGPRREAQVLLTVGAEQVLQRPGLADAAGATLKLTNWASSDAVALTDSSATFWPPGWRPAPAM